MRSRETSYVVVLEAQVRNTPRQMDQIGKMAGGEMLDGLKCKTKWAGIYLAPK